MIGTVSTQLGRITDFLKWEEDDRYSRDVAVVALNQTLALGAVVGVDGSGNIVEYDNETAVSPGGAAAVGIMLEAVTTDGTTTKKAVILARQAKVIRPGLVWKTGLLDADKNAAMADLALLGIIEQPWA